METHRDFTETAKTAFKKNASKKNSINCLLTGFRAILRGLFVKIIHAEQLKKGGKSLPVNITS